MKVSYVQTLRLSEAMAYLRRVQPNGGAAPFVVQVIDVQGHKHKDEDVCRIVLDLAPGEAQRNCACCLHLLFVHTSDGCALCPCEVVNEDVNPTNGASE